MFGKFECRVTNRLLWDYAAMALCEPDMERVEAHISRCRACAKQAEVYALVVGVVKTGRIDRMPESRASWQSLRATLEMERRLPSARRTARSLPVLALGSLAMVVVLTFLFAGETANDFNHSTDFSGFPSKGIGDPPSNSSEFASVGPDVGKFNNHAMKTGGLGHSDAVQESMDPNREVSVRPGTAADQRDSHSHPLPLQSPLRPTAQPARYVSGDQADRPFDSSPRRDYVLTPVGMGGSRGNGAHFVMGTIPRSEGGITTASYTKPVEEAPVW
jgi:hypothetical protein